MNIDFNTYIEILSTPPNHKEYGIGCTEGSKWQSRCIKEVLPGILKHLQNSPEPKIDSVKAVRAIQKAHQHPEVGGHSKFDELVWRIIDISIDYSRKIVLYILCEIVAESTTSLDWVKTVRKLIEHEHVCVALYAVPTVLRRHSKRLFRNTINRKEFYAAIEAIYALKWHQRKEITKNLLECNDELIKGVVIDALFSFGDMDAISLLKKRLGGFFGKPEKDKYIRDRIKKAIDNIVKRNK